MLQTSQYPRGNAKMAIGICAPIPSAEAGHVRFNVIRGAEVLPVLLSLKQSKALRKALKAAEALAR